MKKLLPGVMMAFASLTALAGSASAGHTFGLFTGCCCCKACGGTITLRQYNAFSPVACGSMMFQGCVVAPPPQQPYYGGFDGFGGEVIGGDCGDGSCGSGIPVGQMPAGFPGGAFTYPNAAYTYGPLMQMPPAQVTQYPMPQMQTAPLQAPQMQVPVSYPVAPAQNAQPAGARMP